MMSAANIGLRIYSSWKIEYCTSENQLFCCLILPLSLWAMTERDLGRGGSFRPSARLSICLYKPVPCEDEWSQDHAVYAKNNNNNNNNNTW